MRRNRKGWSGITAVQGGCNTCGLKWHTANTLAVAARHYDATGHPTWVDQVMAIRYGEDATIPPDADEAQR